MMPRNQLTHVTVRDRTICGFIVLYIIYIRVLHVYQGVLPHKSCLTVRLEFHYTHNPDQEFLV